jgi:hypothetical protein
MQVACLLTRGMVVAVMASVRNWRRVAKSMLRGCGGFGGVAVDRNRPQASELSGRCSLLKQRKIQSQSQRKGIVNGRRCLHIAQRTRIQSFRKTHCSGRPSRVT